MTATVRVIKRYANRKLYDTQASSYVTLEQVADLIRQGEDIQVVDNATKEDMTSVTLAQIILEEEKRQKSFLPLPALQKIIRSGGESLHELVAQLHQSAGRVGRVFRRDEDALIEEGGAEELPGQSVDSAEPVGMIRDFVESVQGAVDDWQRRLDQNVHNAWETVSPLAPLQREIKVLSERIEEMERRLPGRSAASGGDGKPPSER